MLPTLDKLVPLVTVTNLVICPLPALDLLCVICVNLPAIELMSSPFSWAHETVYLSKQETNLNLCRRRSLSMIGKTLIIKAWFTYDCRLWFPNVQHCKQHDTTTTNCLSPFTRVQALARWKVKLIRNSSWKK